MVAGGVLHVSQAGCLQCKVNTVTALLDLLLNAYKPQSPVGKNKSWLSGVRTPRTSADSCVLRAGGATLRGNASTDNDTSAPAGGTGGLGYTVSTPVPQAGLPGANGELGKRYCERPKPNTCISSSSCAHALSVLCCLIRDSTLILTCHDAQAQAAWVVMWVTIDSRGTRDRVGAAVVEVWAYLLTAHTMAGGHAI